MSLVVVEAIRGQCGSFLILIGTVLELFGGQTNSFILVYLWFSLTESGINIHAAIFTMLLMAICDCTDEAKTNPTHLNVVTVLCFSSPRWFVHSFLYYHNPGTAFGFCPAVSNSTFFPQLV